MSQSIFVADSGSNVVTIERSKRHWRIAGWPTTMIKSEQYHDRSNTWRVGWRSDECISINGVNLKVSQSTPEIKWCSGVLGILQTRDHVVNAYNDVAINDNGRLSKITLILQNTRKQRKSALHLMWHNPHTK